MIVYRLSKTKFAGDLSGKGAEISGGRWNSKGVATVYTSESRALATTEIAVHSSLANIPLDYNIITIEIPDNFIFEPNLSDLPADWSDIPPRLASQHFGDRFIHENRYLAMKIPSAVVVGDFNFIINPHHKDINLVKIISISPFSFDKRLFK
ncbi:MAG TPA: RES family NAD+ phosphorylase [Paludibacter sp.]|nr:RES family NAD+ phosphorylase [Paludibacter sp.]